MTPTQVLMSAATGLARKLNDPEARRAAAIAASAVSMEQITRAGDDADLLSALRSSLMAINERQPAQRHHISIAIAAMVGALRMRIAQHSTSARRAPNLWWVE